MKLDKVLVPLDGSPLAEVALAHVVELVGGRRTKILLVRAAEAHEYRKNIVLSQMNAIREADEYLKAIRDRLLTQGLSDVDTSVWFGPAASAIIEAAETQEPDLIVMNSHGRGGLGRLVLGSVAEAVLRGTRTPILLLREPGAPIEKSAGVARPVEPSST